MRDVRRPRRGRLAAATAALPAATAKRVRLKAPPAVEPALPPQKLPAKPRSASVISGVDGATAERLRRGRVEPDATLYLHGMTQQQAFTRLLAFVRRGHDHGNRCLLVITGKGVDVRAEDETRQRG